MLSKNVNNKKCAPKLIFFNEKKIEKDSDNHNHLVSFRGDET